MGHGSERGRAGRDRLRGLAHSANLKYCCRGRETDASVTYGSFAEATARDHVADILLPRFEYSIDSLAGLTNLACKNYGYYAMAGTVQEPGMGSGRKGNPPVRERTYFSGPTRIQEGPW